MKTKLVIVAFLLVVVSLASLMYVREHRFSVLRAKADAGDAESQFHLGVCFQRGEGVETNPVEAARLYRRSAEQGYIHGQYRLGRCYEDGLGVEQDAVQEYKWFSLSLVAKDHDRPLPLGLGRMQTAAIETTLLRLESKMTPEQIAEAKRQSAEFKPKPEK